MPFGPTEFTQVNHAVNGVLVRRAMALLAPRAGEHVADFFCGLGNFTLPIARLGANVLGVEGADALVAREERMPRRTASANARASRRRTCSIPSLTAARMKASAPGRSGAIVTSRMNPPDILWNLSSSAGSGSRTNRSWCTPR